jgi:N-acetyl-anhydromuramyl-L-alanine amidase AmpD
MSNSPLVTYTHLSKHYVSPREKAIDTISIHHAAVVKASLKGLGNGFNGSRKASSNYGIDNDGQIGMFVEEKNRAVTSSSKANDSRAVTIEVVNSSGAPDWKVSDKALESLIRLCVDICQRNGIKKLNFTGDKTGNLTMHKWFAATACPGPYLESKFPWIAEEVNRRLKATSAPQSGEKIYRVQVGAFREKANAERQLAELKTKGFDGFITEVTI